METFSALLALGAGNSPVSGEFPAQRPVTRNVDVFFDLHLIKRWVNTREASDLWRYRAHYGVIVMTIERMSNASEVILTVKPSNMRRMLVRQIPKLKRFSSHLAVVFAHAKPYV